MVTIHYSSDTQTEPCSGTVAAYYIKRPTFGCWLDSFSRRLISFSFRFFAWRASFLGSTAAPGRGLCLICNHQSLLVLYVHMTVSRMHRCCDKKRPYIHFNRFWPFACIWSCSTPLVTLQPRNWWKGSNWDAGKLDQTWPTTNSVILLQDQWEPQPISEPQYGGIISPMCVRIIRRLGSVVSVTLVSLCTIVEITNMAGSWNERKLTVWRYSCIY